MRIMGLDFGSKTVGVAVSDSLLITAQGVEIIRREKRKDYVDKIAAVLILQGYLDYRGMERASGQSDGSDGTEEP